MGVARTVTMRMARMPVRTTMGGRPVVAMMSQTAHGHGGESYTTKCEAGQVEVHQLARGVFICSLTIHEIPGAWRLVLD